MELLFGTHVRSGGRRLGYLAGLEVDAASRTVSKIIFSDDAKLGSHAHTRPLQGARQENGALTVTDAGNPEPPRQPALLSRSVRVVQNGREIGRVSGAVVGDAGALQAILSRQHWWSKRHRVAADAVDLTFAGEVRVGSGKPLAA